MNGTDDSPNYEWIFKRSSGKRKHHKSEMHGDLSRLQRGDVVTYHLKDNGYVTAVVEKVNALAERLRVCRTVVDVGGSEWVMRPARTMAFEEIIFAQRPLTPETLASVKRALDRAEANRARVPSSNS